MNGIIQDIESIGQPVQIVRLRLKYMEEKKMNPIEKIKKMQEKYKELKLKTYQRNKRTISSDKVKEIIDYLKKHERIFLKNESDFKYILGNPYSMKRKQYPISQDIKKHTNDIIVRTAHTEDTNETVYILQLRK